MLFKLKDSRPRGNDKLGIPGIILGIFFLFALFNPVFKKYDYGAGWPIVIIFALIVFFLSLLAFRRREESSLVETLSLVIFGGAVAASFYFSQTKNVGLSEVLAYTSMIPFYLIFAYRKIDWMRSFLKILLIGLVLAVLVGYFLYFFWPETRMFGVFFNVLYHAHKWPNAFALFLLMGWPVFLFFRAEKVKKIAAARRDILFLIVLPVIFAALLLTFSRGALIVLGGQLVLLFIYFVKRTRWKVVLGIIFVALASIAIFVGMNALRAQQHEVIDVGEKVRFENQESLTSKQERMEFWDGAIELTREKPLFGWGPFSFRYAYNPIQKTFLANSDHPHNLFLKISTENGLIALGAFLAFLFSVFFVVARRFSDLAQYKRDQVYVLGVAVAGAFAHNLIDYNFNFFVNLFLLFILIIFIRSMVVGRKQNVKSRFLTLVLTLIIVNIAIFEGFFLVLAKTVDESFLEYSYFPRNHFMNMADEAISNNDFDLAGTNIENHLALNPLDAQAWYLKGIWCRNSGLSVDTSDSNEICVDFYQKAYSLNPMNDFVYYLDYLRLIDDKRVADQGLFLLYIYFDYVENNTHFTAYTNNVEKASDLALFLASYLHPSDAADLLRRSEKMMDTAKRLRDEKDF